jgi:hypothetical protein
MSNTIKLKRGSGSDPGASDLSVGELAIRTDTGKIFTKKDNGSVAEISGGGGGIDDGDKGDITVSNGGDTFTIDSGVISTAKIADNAVNLGKLFQHNLNGFIATNANADCTVPTFPSHSGDTFVVHDLQLNRDSSNNDPVISPGSQATITFKTSTSASGAFGSILDGTGLQLGRNTEYVKLAAPQDQSGQASYTLTFPPTSGSNNQFLQTDGSGTTTWASVAFLNQNQVIALYDQSSTPVQRVLVGTEGMTIQGTPAAVSKLMFRDRTTANFLKFKPVDTLSAGVEFTLPSADGSANHVLKTDGSGVMSFGQIATASITDDAVTYAKIQNVSATNRILGRDSSGAGVIEEITPANLRTMINVEDGATADQTAAEIRTLVGNASDSNVFTDALLSKLNGIAASATNVTNNNQLTNGAGYITATLTQEQVEDIVGGMVSGNTVSGISVTYSDSGGKLNFSVASQTDNNFTDADHSKLDGIAAGATNVTNTNQLTNGAGFITSADGGNAATLDSLDSTQFLRSDASDTMTGTLTIGDGSAQTELHIKKADNNVPDHLQFYNGTTLVGEIGVRDTSWLRLNNQSTANIYTPRYIRADGGFFVDGITKGINGSGNFIGGTIAGASDYDTLLRSDAADTASSLLSLTTGLAFGANAKCSASLHTLSDGSTITVDFNTGIHQAVTLGGNRTLGDPSNTGTSVGQSGSIFITQDGTGSRTLSFHADYKFVGGSAPTLSTAANAVDRIDYVIKDTNVVHCAISLDVK